MLLIANHAGPGKKATGFAYLITHGKSGAVGLFGASAPLALARGDRVVVASERGLELGVVLCPASAGHVQLMGNVTPGQLLRRTTPDDEKALARIQALSQEIFAQSRRLISELALPLEILDVEMLLDGRQAILQWLGQECDASPLLQALENKFSLEIFLENLALPAEKPEHGGCDKPDCGRGAGGSCTTCSTGGGCSSCGSAKVDMRAYFGHLRGQMENRQRKPLL